MSSTHTQTAPPRQKDLIDTNDMRKIFSPEQPCVMNKIDIM